MEVSVAMAVAGAGIIITALGSVWAMGRRESAVDTSLTLLRQEVLRGQERLERGLAGVTTRLQAHELQNAADWNSVREQMVTNLMFERHQELESANLGQAREEHLQAIQDVHNRLDAVLTAVRFANGQRGVEKSTTAP